VQGRLRSEALEVEIATSCGHCGRAMHLVVDDRLHWRVKESGADPHLFLPHMDWAAFRKPNIIDDY